MSVCPACNGRKHIGHLGPLERCAICKGTGVAPKDSAESAMLDLYVDPAALSGPLRPGDLRVLEEMRAGITWWDVDDEGYPGDELQRLRDRGLIKPAAESFEWELTTAGREYRAATPRIRPAVLSGANVVGFELGGRTFGFHLDEVTGHVSPRQMGRVALSVCEVMIPLRPTPAEANASTPDEWSFSVEVECEGVIVSMYSRARRRAFRRVIPESPTVDSWAAAVKDCHQIVCEILSECRATRPKAEQPKVRKFIGRWANGLTGSAEHRGWSVTCLKYGELIATVDPEESDDVVCESIRSQNAERGSFWHGVESVEVSE